MGGLRGDAAGGGEVLALDLGDHPQVVATIVIPPPAQARFVAISLDGKRTYVTGGQSVSRPLVIEIALTTDGGTAFVSNNVGTVYAIRTSSMTLIDDPNNPIPVDPAAWGVAAC